MRCATLWDTLFLSYNTSTLDWVYKTCYETLFVETYSVPESVLLLVAFSLRCGWTRLGVLLTARYILIFTRPSYPVYSTYCSHPYSKYAIIQVHCIHDKERYEYDIRRSELRASYSLGSWLLLCSLSQNRLIVSTPGDELFIRRHQLRFLATLLFYVRCCARG